MTVPLLVPGMPGIRGALRATHRSVFDGGQWERYLPGGKVIDGSKSRDPGNTGAIHVLRPGTLMGLITASGKYAPSVIGSLQADAAAAATSITVSPAEAEELVRRVGATGTITLIGPPTPGGTVAIFTETYSAVNVQTGVITVSALNAALEAGSFVAADDGSHVPLTMIPDGWGQIVTDRDTTTSIDVPFSHLPIGGPVKDSQLLPWPADAALRQWVRDQLSTTSRGKFVFTELY